MLIARVARLTQHLIKYKCTRSYSSKNEVRVDKLFRIKISSGIEYLSRLPTQQHTPLMYKSGFDCILAAKITLQKKFERTKILYDSMMHHGVEFELDTFKSLINCLAVSRPLVAAETFRDLAMDGKIKPDTDVVDKVMTALSEHYEDNFTLIKELYFKWNEEFKLEPNMMQTEILMSSAIKRNHQLAVETFKNLPESINYPINVFYKSLARDCVRRGMNDDLQNIFNNEPNKKLLCLAVMSLYNVSGHAERSIVTFEKAEEPQDVHTLSELLESYVLLDNPSKAEQVYNTIINSGDILKKKQLTSIIRSYQKLDQHEKCFNLMYKCGKPKWVSGSVRETLLKSIRDDQWRIGLKLFEDSKFVFNRVPEADEYRTVAVALAKHSQYHTLERLLVVNGRRNVILRLVEEYYTKNGDYCQFKRLERLSS
ncbi:hypothetical protein AKO1_005104 [Acrasis kona]|uniref:Uncharacterized protein n=1 Tax=Acrasis kona TaxID=1008807 RepID=A0AAW2Z4W4_9EUKA